MDKDFDKGFVKRTITATMDSKHETILQQIELKELEKLSKNKTITIAPPEKVMGKRRCRPIGQITYNEKINLLLGDLDTYAKIQEHN